MFATRCFALVFVAVFGFVGIVQTSDRPDLKVSQHRSAMARFKSSNPGAHTLEEGARIARVYGRAFSTGSDPVASAQRFVDDHIAIFGLRPQELEPRSLLRDGQRIQPVFYRRETGTYKFTLIHYRQHHDDIPVFRSDLRLLVRNEPDNPLVWAGSALRDLDGFEIHPYTREDARRPDVVNERFDLGKSEIRKLDPGIKSFAAPRTVIWAGVDAMKVEPRLALSFVGDNFFPGGAANKRYLYITDFETGRVLYEEDLLLRDISGNVSGMATEGPGADECDSEVATPMPYVEATDGSTTVFTDENGDFVIPGSAIRADSTPLGQYFVVMDFQGSLEVASAGAPFDILLNAANTDELIRAQVNGYIEANVVRDYALAFNPSYPTLTDTETAVWVNRTDGFCPGNAWYSPGDPSSASGYSINFCSSAPNRPNTSYSSVVYHEFGHHLIQASGSGQGQYGEGQSDVVSLVLLDDPRIGVGFFGNCNGSLRRADNPFQYPCSGASHFCGNLMSGCAWDLRQKLVVSNPMDYRDILSNLALNAILLHQGSLITPAITIDYLTLDDDDADLFNGTPHYDQINAAFSAHNMPGPELVVGLRVSPSASLVATDGGGSIAPTSIQYTVENGSATSIDYSVTALESWLSVGGGSGTLLPGGSAMVDVSINDGADTLGNGLHRGNVFFANQTGGSGNTIREVLLLKGGAALDAADVPQFISLFATANSTITASDDFCIGDVNVSVDVTHDDISELTVSLLSPQGTSVTLYAPSSGIGTSLDVTYDEQAGSPAAGPGALSDFNGESPLGSWMLTVSDNFLPNNGNLNAWSLQILPCSPTANAVEATVLKTFPSPITLDAQSSSGGALSYVITSLPAQGSLSDPNGGPIASVPYELLSNGDTVIYDPADVYAGRDAFSYKANDGQDSNLADVDVQVGEQLIVQSFDLDSDPGWTTAGLWDFGQPTGGGWRSVDPTAGFTGTNVYGYNLAGDYEHNLTEQALTSSAIDCSGFEGVELRFRRWLGVEVAPYDNARIEASNDGTSWTTVWEHSGAAINESDWSLQTYDISAIADNEATVYLRWVMGGTDNSVAYHGWNIDDIEITGVVPVARVDLTVEPADLNWAPMADAVAYDAVWGDLAALRSSGGDYGAAALACLGDDIAGTTVAAPPEPDPGVAQWFLVRGVATLGNMSFDSFGDGQVESRDAEIDGAAMSCP